MQNYYPNIKGKYISLSFLTSVDLSKICLENINYTGTNKGEI